MRRRECDNPRPTDGGLSCNGSGMVFINGDSEDCTVEEKFTEMCKAKCPKRPCPSIYLCKLAILENCYCSKGKLG